MKRMTGYFLALVILLAGCAQTGGTAKSVPLTDTPLYGKFVWHDLITDDVKAAKAFYGGLFGWTFEDTTRPGGGAYTLIVSEKGLYVGGIVQVNDAADGSDYSRWLGYLAVPDVDEYAAATADAGGEIVIAARDLGMVARVAAVSDPQGAVLGLINSRVGYPQDNFNAGYGAAAFSELIAADARVAADFYRDLVNADVVNEQRDGQPYLMLKVAGRNRAGVIQRSADNVDPLWLTHFSVRDAGSSAQQAARLGGNVLIDANDDLRDGEVALIVDPTGAVLAVNSGL